MERFVTLLSRAEASDGMTLSGYAAVYDQPTTRQRDYAGAETIARTAFSGLLDGDVAALVNHDPHQLLGRTSSGTLRLSSDDHGLRFELDLPDTALGRDVRTLVQRGDIRGMSFTAAVGAIQRTKSGVTHTQFKRLVDVSPVTFPAYEGTSLIARNADPEWVRAQLVLARARVRFEGKQNG